MVKVDAVRQSANSFVNNSKSSRRSYDKLWGVANRAPVFCKKSKRLIGGKEKPVYRTSRLIGTHAYNIAASGAAAQAAVTLEKECSLLRVEYASENQRAPWLPSLLKGSKMVLEQFLCALAQEATIKAHAVRELERKKRLSAKHMQIGWDAVNETVFGGTSLMPKRVYMAPYSKPSKKQKKSDGKGKENPEEQEAEAAEDVDN